jgi:hypothetical protein
VDRESAFEMLSRRTEAAGAQAEAAPADADPFAQWNAGGGGEPFRQGRRYEPAVPPPQPAPKRASRRSDSAGEAFAKSLARTIGSSTGRAIVRGVLGGLFKGR